MSKKIAIMTWHTYDNYGSVLQAYALRTSILNNITDSTVDLINYSPRPKRVAFKQRLCKSNIQRHYWSRKLSIREKMNLKSNFFSEFRKSNFTYTDKCDNATDLFLLNDKYDKFVCGSDQIWAPTLFDENYFLSFVTNNSKKVAYAPSIGLPQIDNDVVKKKMANLISCIPNLSIREDRGKEIIKEICNKDSKLVLDPTLLLDKNTWKDELGLKEKTGNRDYIIFYCLGSNNNHYEVAKKIASKLNKKLLIIANDILDLKNAKRDVVIPSPKKFLELIYNAYAVITDSFHGTIFSINFNVPFITLRRFTDNELSQNSRIYSILKMLDLQDRLYNYNIDYFIDNIKLDFSKTNKLLAEKRKDSLNFLVKSLNSENINHCETVITNFCAGCGMCEIACPKQCISIEKNNEGFFEYKIDHTKCIKCNICKKVCGQRETQPYSIQNSELYSAVSNNKEVIKTSSSGGLAYEMCHYALEKDIPVIGVEYDNNAGIAKHVMITDTKDIIRLSGSKYIQSYTVEGFKNIERISKAIVIGTPCQIASVHKYLEINKKRDNFILIDLICHGIPSYYLWDKFISKYKIIYNINFRDKRYGWRKKDMVINQNNHIKENKNRYYDFFELSNVNNKCCYECKYRKDTFADVRIGDYWGEKFKKNTSGVSMVILNTQRGKELFNKLILYNKISVQRQDVKDYFLAQQTENILVGLERERIIAELKDKNKNLHELYLKYCKKERNHRRLVKNIMPVMRMLREGINHGKK